MLTSRQIRDRPLVPVPIEIKVTSLFLLYRDLQDTLKIVLVIAIQLLTF